MAERDGEVIGAALTLPDVNQVLDKMSGSLLPLGWLRFLRGRAQDRPRARLRARRHARVPAPGDRRRACTQPPRGRHATGIPGAETGWILETNEPMNRAMEGMGGKVVKKYRLLREGPLRPSAGRRPLV